LASPHYLDPIYEGNFFAKMKGAPECAPFLCLR
jgi:hypothetical protein